MKIVIEYWVASIESLSSTALSGSWYKLPHDEALSDKEPLSSPALFLARFLPIAGSGIQHSMADALSYPRHARLERDLVNWLTKKVFDKLRLWRVMMDIRMRVARLMVDYDESGAVTAGLTINLTSLSDVALGRPLPS
ncbi:uncharacterized protein TNCV_643961 [Trichonephila clavipes]|nr:uncharacterized protein TNCV_643961 [Trichonephila clavipes]